MDSNGFEGHVLPKSLHQDVFTTMRASTAGTRSEIHVLLSRRSTTTHRNRIESMSWVGTHSIERESMSWVGTHSIERRIDSEESLIYILADIFADINMLLTVDHRTYVSLYSNICCEDVALTYIEGWRQMVCSLLGGHGGAQLVTEEPSLSRRSPALQSKMGVWPWASMALGGYGLGSSVITHYRSA
ncbi:hypothetical protein Scep_021449 [Stephania cephalantha]|uniref:Uncharacterized protein n=1 Tax=Stephania cephalantha TaxID=152367 RepID=A0AAP0F3F5_9MAGN